MKDKISRAKQIFWGTIPFHDRQRRAEELVEFLSRIHLFETLSRGQIKALSEVLHVREYEAGEPIFEIHQPGTALFIIFDGEVSIESPDSHGHYTEIAKLESENFFGELALLDQSPRSASARALKRTKLLALYRNDLNQLSDTNPQLSSRIFQSLAIIIGERLKEMNKMMEVQYEEAS